MRVNYPVLMAIGIVLATPTVIAKNKGYEKPMGYQSMMEGYNQFATPGEQHKMLAGLVGNWTTLSKEWIDPNKPPIESAGSVEMKSLLGGRFLQEDITGQMMGRPYSGISIIGYDNFFKRYVITSMSTMSTGIFMMEGPASVDGKTITLSGKHLEPGGGYMVHHAIWKIVDNNTQTFEMRGAHHGGKEWKMLEMIYTRK